MQNVRDLICEMVYGLIGEHLGHSFSKEIHERIAGYGYELREVAKGELDAFIDKREFRAVNVTIPYKESVIPLLDELDQKALSIGAVNTIVNRNGRLVGYNTDYDGFREMALRKGASFNGCGVLVLGGGGAAKAIAAVARDEGASDVTFAVRHIDGGNQLLYGELEDRYDIIVNATPCGMYPFLNQSPISIGRFTRAGLLLDCIYNPLRSQLVMDARKHGIKAEGGLYMLVSQAIYAVELFTGKAVDHNLADVFYGSISREKENIVLCGMPSCGKTSVGRELAALTGRRFIDTDSLITERTGLSITEYFASYSEESFRKVESSVIDEISPLQGCVIATGGGAVLNDSNVRNLKQNGKFVFLDTEIDNLYPTSDRPLSSSRENLERLFVAREPLYRAAADFTLDNNREPRETAVAITELLSAI